MRGGRQQQEEGGRGRRLHREQGWHKEMAHGSSLYNTMRLLLLRNAPRQIVTHISSAFDLKISRWFMMLQLGRQA